MIRGALISLGLQTAGNCWRIQLGPSETAEIYPDARLYSLQDQVHNTLDELAGYIILIATPTTQRFTAPPTCPQTYQGCQAIAKLTRGAESYVQM